MIVVADTTPLLYLSRIGLVALVNRVHGEVVVPETVWRELVISRPGAPGVAELLGAHWIRVTDEAERKGVDSALAEELDPGEAAAISLAALLHADTLLIDERRGREVARRYGLRIQGTLGILVAARRSGALVAVRPALDALTTAGFRVSSVLIAEVLRMVGEE